MSFKHRSGDVYGAKEFFEKPELYFRNRHIVDLRRELAQELLGELKDASLLDLGCGDGSISLPFLRDNNRLVLVDFSQSMIELVKQSIPEGLEDAVEIHNMDVDAFESGEAFDIVLCLGVLAHVRDPKRTFRRLARHLKPGGRCLLQITDSDTPASRMVRMLSKIKRLSRSCGGRDPNKISGSELKQWARGSGLTFLQVSSYSIGMPGVNRFLPQSLLRRYTELTLRRESLGFLCSEKVFLFRKDGI